MTVPVFIADFCVWGPDGDRLGSVVEMASFSPIPSSRRPGRGGNVVTVDRGDRPRAWVKAPLGSGLVGTGTAARLHLFGERESAKAAWVVLGLARMGVGGYRLVPEPEGVKDARPVKVC